MPDTDKKKNKPQSKLARSKSAIIVAIVAVLVVGGLLLLLNRREGSSGVAKSTSADVIDAQIAKDTASGNFSASEKALQKAPNTEEYDLLRISLYRTQGNDKAALEVYKRLIDNGGTSYFEDAASVAVATGDKQLAIQYYESAKQQLVKSNSPTKEAEAEAIEAQITALKGQQ